MRNSLSRSSALSAWPLKNNFMLIARTMYALTALPETEHAAAAASNERLAGSSRTHAAATSTAGDVAGTAAA